MKCFKIMALVTAILTTGLISTPLRAAGKFVVVTTSPELAAIAGEVLGKPGSVYSIGMADEDPHYVAAKPSQMVKLRNANAIVYNGLELEIGYLPKLLEGARNPDIMPGKPGNLDASKAIKKILEVPTGEVDRSRGDIHPLGNPHYMTNPYNGVLVAKWMGERFGELDKANAALYSANAGKFATMMQGRIEQWERQAQNLKGFKVVVYHNTWRYLADWLRLDIVGFIEDKPGIPPTPHHVIELEQTIKNDNVKIIIREVFNPVHAADNLSAATGAKVIVLPSSINEQEGVKSYPDIFERIISKLEAAIR